MASQNVDNVLNLALDATEEERVKSLNLNVGYDAEEKEWEVIVKYSGSLEAVRAFALGVTELRNEYAIVRVKESDIQRLSAVPQIIYIEKPKRLFLQNFVDRDTVLFGNLSAPESETTGDFAKILEPFVDAVTIRNT